MYAAAEAALAAAMGMQYLNGDSGLKKEALWSSMTTMAALVAVRAYFLYNRADCMVVPTNAKKTQ